MCICLAHSTVLVHLYLPCPSLFVNYFPLSLNVTGGWLSHLGLSCKLNSGFLLGMNDLYETEATSAVRLKSKLPPSRETRLVSLETRLERSEMSLVSNETSLVSRECTGSTNTSLSSIFKPVLCIIVTICAVGTIFILISDVCVPCVYYKNGNFL